MGWTAGLGAAAVVATVAGVVLSLHSPGARPWSIWGAGPSHGFVLTSYGRLLASTDGGLTWTQVD